MNYCSYNNKINDNHTAGFDRDKMIFKFFFFFGWGKYVYLLFSKWAVYAMLNSRIYLLCRKQVKGRISLEFENNLLLYCLVI